MRSKGDSSTSWRHEQAARVVGLQQRVVGAQRLALRSAQHRGPGVARGVLDPLHAGPPAPAGCSGSATAVQMRSGAAGTVRERLTTGTRRRYPSRRRSGCARRAAPAARGRRGRPARSRTRSPPPARRRPRPGRTGRAAVPPVASRSSCTSTRAPAGRASACTSSASTPYSSWYSTDAVSRGSLPGLRARMKPGAGRRRHGAAEHEAARLGGDHVLRLDRPRVVRQRSDRRPQRLRGPGTAA